MPLTTQSAPEETPKERIQAAMERHGITVQFEFVPFSKSRNSEEACKSLNWRVTLWSQRGTTAQRRILITDYSAGVGHCTAYKASMKLLGGRNCIMRDAAIMQEVESGREWNGGLFRLGKKHEPDACNVIHSLAMDSDVLEYATFEDWAENTGFDPDSRKHEATYRACLEIALKLRCGLGERTLAELKAACQDY